MDTDKASLYSKEDFAFEAFVRIDSEFPDEEIKGYLPFRVNSTFIASLITIQTACMNIGVPLEAMLSEPKHGWDGKGIGRDPATLVVSGDEFRFTGQYNSLPSHTRPLSVSSLVAKLGEKRARTDTSAEFFGDFDLQQILETCFVPNEPDPSGPTPSNTLCSKSTLDLAHDLADAVSRDEAPDVGGFDLSGGLLGPNVSEWLRTVADEIGRRDLLLARAQQVLASLECQSAFEVSHVESDPAYVETKLEAVALLKDLQAGAAGDSASVLLNQELNPTAELPQFLGPPAACEAIDASRDAFGGEVADCLHAEEHEYSVDEPVRPTERAC